MQQRRFENGKEIYDYEITGGKAHVTCVEGQASRIEVPEQIEGCPVAVIERKAFLSRKTLHTVTLPDTIEEIGDWAFAHCDNLREISLPGKDIRFGRAAFKNCGKLKRIMVRPYCESPESCPRNPRSQNELSCSFCKTAVRQTACSCGLCASQCVRRHTVNLQTFMHGGAVGCMEVYCKNGGAGAVSGCFEGGETDCNTTVQIQGAVSGGRAGELAEQADASPELLAAAVTMLDAYYLLDLPAAGSREWLGKWDSRLRSLLRTADQEGYISQSVYGEEDYIGTDLEEYVSARRKEKVRLAFVRLLHPQALDPELKEELEGYLRRLTKGREEEEAWQVLLREHGSDREYYSLFAAISCVTEENLDGILADIGDEYPEMKAFFLTLDKSGGDGDFFAGLEL